MWFVSFVCGHVLVGNYYSFSIGWLWMADLHAIILKFEAMSDHECNCGKTHTAVVPVLVRKVHQWYVRFVQVCLTHWRFVKKTVSLLLYWYTRVSSQTTVHIPHNCEIDSTFFTHTVYPHRELVAWTTVWHRQSIHIVWFLQKWQIYASAHAYSHTSTHPSVYTHSILATQIASAQHGSMHKYFASVI